MKDLLAAATQSNEVAAFLEEDILRREELKKKEFIFSALKLLLNRRKYV